MKKRWKFSKMTKKRKKLGVKKMQNNEKKIMDSNGKNMKWIVKIVKLL